MKIFAKLKNKFPVDRVFVVRKNSTLRPFHELHTSHKTVSLLHYFAIEFHNTCLVIVECQGGHIATRIDVTLFNRRRKFVYKAELTEMMRHSDRDISRVGMLVTDVIGEIAATTQAGVLSPELDAGRLVVWERKGDTVVYRKLHRRHAREHLGNYVKEIIRKRDHAVRGHLRTLQNGRQCWVRSHRRGDLELGTVVAIQELE